MRKSSRLQDCGTNQVCPKTSTAQSATNFYNISENQEKRKLNNKKKIKRQIEQKIEKKSKESTPHGLSRKWSNIQNSGK